MARSRKKMTEEDLARAISSQIDDAKAFDGSDRSKDREWALKFFEGEIDIKPMAEGRSSIVSRDVSDTHGLILPGLMRIFFSSARVVSYEPTRPEHEEYAELASDYVNYVVMQECGGFKQFRSALSDGLLLGNGIVKHWWDDTPEYSTESFTGLTEEKYRLILDDPDVEELEDDREEYEDPDFVAPDPDEMMQQAAQAGIPLQGLDPSMISQLMPAAPKLYDVKIKRLKSNGRLRMMGLPPEEFWIERSATALDETVRFCTHRYRSTRSELIKDGYKRAKVDAIPIAGDMEGELARHARDADAWMSETAPDKATEMVDVFECYILIDMDGDGIAERRRVVMAGQSGKRAILSNEEWGDDLPFSDIVPDPVPHRWRGRSLYDLEGDIQRVNTVLIRGAMDNMYKVLAPQRTMEEGSVLNPDEVYNPSFDGVIVYKKGSQPPTALPNEYIVPQILPVIEYMNQVSEKRTGISMRSQSQNMDALQNQSATAANIAQSAAHSKVEEYARNIAECGGMRRIFACCLRLITKHQDRAKTIRLQGKLVEIDPRSWNAEMDVSINTGLGTGSRERDLTILSGIAGKQEALMQMGGPFNPVVGLKQVLATYQKMAEAGGIRNPEQFFPDVTDEMLAELKQQQQPQGQQQPDPQMAAMQAKMQMEQQKFQAEMQMEQAKLQMQMQADAEERQFKAQGRVQEMELANQLKRDETAARVQATRDEAAAKLNLMREEMGARIQIAREEMNLKHEGRMNELGLEMQLAEARNAMNVNPDMNLPRPE